MGIPVSTQLSIDTKCLVDLLRGMAVGSEVSYATLTAHLRRDVQAEAQHSLASARRVLLREGIRFDVQRGTGLKRMSDSEIARSGSQGLSRVRRTARREARKVAAVRDFESLSNEDKIQHNTTLSVLGAVAHFTRPAQVKILEAPVAEARSKLPPMESVEQIRRALSPKKKDPEHK